MLHENYKFTNNIDPPEVSPVTSDYIARLRSEFDALRLIDIQGQSDTNPSDILANQDTTVTQEDIRPAIIDIAIDQAVEQSFITYAADNIAKLEPGIEVWYHTAKLDNTLSEFTALVAPVREILLTGDYFGTWQKHCRVFREQDGLEYHVGNGANAYSDIQIASEIVHSLRVRQSPAAYRDFKAHMFYGSDEKVNFGPKDKTMSLREKIDGKFIQLLLLADEFDDRMLTNERVKKISASFFGRFVQKVVTTYRDRFDAAVPVEPLEVRAGYRIIDCRNIDLVDSTGNALVKTVEQPIKLSSREKSQNVTARYLGALAHKAAVAYRSLRRTPQPIAPLEVTAGYREIDYRNVRLRLDA